MVPTTCQSQTDVVAVELGSSCRATDLEHRSARASQPELFGWDEPFEEILHRLDDEKIDGEVSLVCRQLEALMKGLREPNRCGGAALGGHNYMIVVTAV